MTTTTTTAAPRTAAYTIVASVVRFYLIGTLAISFTHIIHAAAMLGLAGWQTYTVPLFIDGFAVLALAGQSKTVLARAEDPDGARRFAFRLQMIAGTLSLAANVFAGANLGERLFGVLIVVGFVTAEKFNHAIRARKTTDAAAVITPADVDAAVTAAVTAALADEATRTADAITAALAKAEKARIARERRAAKKAEADAPTSPAPFAAPAGLVVPTVAEMRALVNAR